ncbi:MAG: PorP/SprF family type IX secretion system membrane protein [Flavobacteriales bacterium]|nr:PorP/SprF family type IX secretion system membrane protein [Flavobacteriales bacterium]
MKQTILYIVGFSFLCLSLFAQQEETYTQYIFNKYALNPAFGGTSKCPDIKFGTRLQWVGFEGAPVTSFFSYHTAVGYQDQRSKNWHGLGIYLVDDRTGFYNSTALYPSYTFHARMSRRVVASAGFFIGIRNFTSGISGNIDPIMTPTTRMIFPDLGGGVLIYSPEWFVGLSIKQIYTNTASTTSYNGATENLYKFRSRQYYLTLAKWFEAYAFSFSYTPSVLIKYHETVNPSIDISIMFHYIENRLNIGASYRVGDGIAAVLQLNLLKKLSAGYAYEIPLSKISKVSGQTHEIILKWDPCWSTNNHFGKVNCPSF